jgi:hypothetical protein
MFAGEFDSNVESLEWFEIKAIHGRIVKEWYWWWRSCGVNVIVALSRLTIRRIVGRRLHALSSIFILIHKI